jgi:hypothetical protein
MILCIYYGEYLSIMKMGIQRQSLNYELTIELSIQFTIQALALTF